MTLQNSTANMSIESQAKIHADSQHGFVGSLWQLAIGTAESSCSLGFGLAQDTRAELRRRADVTLSFAEEIGVGSVKFVRGMVDRVDRVANEGLGRGEAAVFVTTRSLRDAGRGAKAVSSTAPSDTNGSGSNQRRADGARSATA